MVATACASALTVWSIVTAQRRALGNEAAQTLYGAIQVFPQGHRQASELLPLRPNLTGLAALRQRIEAVPGVRAVSARLVFGAMVSNAGEGEGRSASVAVTAFDPAREVLAAPGRFRLVDRTPLPHSAEGVLLARPLAQALKLDQGAGAAVVLASDVDELLNGVEVPLQATFIPVLPTDRLGVWLPLSTAQELLRMPDAATELAVAVTDLRDMHQVRDRIAAALGNSVEVETWEDRLPALADMMAGLRVSAMLITLVIALVALMGVAATASLNVRDRRREIGTWVALGARRSFVRQSFIFESALCGLSGAALGIALAALASWVLVQFGVAMKIPGTDVLVDAAPRLNASEAALATVFACAVSILAAWFPAQRASRVAPAEALADR